MAGEEQRDIRRELVELLLEKIQADQYPSTTMLDLVEEMLTPEEIPVYAGILMDKTRSDTYPSISLMDRVRSLAGAR